MTWGHTGTNVDLIHPQTESFSGHLETPFKTKPVIYTSEEDFFRSVSWKSYRSLDKDIISSSLYPQGESCITMSSQLPHWTQQRMNLIGCVAHVCVTMNFSHDMNGSGSKLNPPLRAGEFLKYKCHVQTPLILDVALWLLFKLNNIRRKKVVMLHHSPEEFYRNTHRCEGGPGTAASQHTHTHTHTHTRTHRLREITKFEDSCHWTQAFLPRSFFTSSTLMYMLTLGCWLLLLMLLPEVELGLARHPAPSSSSRKKKPPSLHSTECGQARGSDGLPEPRVQPNIAVVLWLAVALGFPRSPTSLSSACEVNPGGRHYEPLHAAAPLVAQNSARLFLSSAASRAKLAC